ncbi:MAG: MipA/OmpV family protein [Granulosicoccus sp.]
MNKLVAHNFECPCRITTRPSRSPESNRWFVAFFFIALFVQPLLAEETEAPVAVEAPDVLALSSNITQKPRWELGIAGGYFSGFDYPASSDANERAIALPFFVYRTPLLKLGDGGLSAVAIQNPRYKLDLSIGGSLNASSEGNSARQGMPDLDFLFEVGPQLQVELFDRPLASGARLKGWFSSELRAVFSTDFRGVGTQGVVADAGVGVDLVNIADTGISLITGLDVSFASERLHDYFYEVDQEFVTDMRPLYDATGGYLETTLVVGFFMKPVPQVSIFAGVIQGFFDGTANEGSPLFDVTEQTRFALGVAWTIKTSKTMVNVMEMGSSNDN